jgi:hypothetical protein
LVEKEKERLINHTNKNVKKSKIKHSKSKSTKKEWRHLYANAVNSINL